MASVRRLRRDLAAFAAESGSPLTDWQLDALRLATPVTVIAAARQMGKSRALATLALWWAFRRADQRVLALSASEASSRELLAEVRGIVGGSPLLAGSVTDEQAGRVTLSNGSRIECGPASTRFVRGRRIDLLLVDEAAFVADELILGAAFPTTLAQAGAKIVLASSPAQAAGAFFDLFRKGEIGDEHVRSYRWVSRLVGGPDEAPWLQPSMIEAQRGAMSAVMFDAELRARFGAGGDFWISRARLERAVADYPVADLAELQGPARMLLGVDWGRRSDRSAAVAIARLPGPGRVFGIVGLRRFAAGVPIPDVAATIAAPGPHYHAVIAEKTGMGDACCDVLFPMLGARRAHEGGGRRRSPFVVVSEGAYAPPTVRRIKAPPPGFHTIRQRHDFTAQSKPRNYAALRLLIEQGRLVIPAAATELRRELELLKVDFSPTGGERIEASSGHDDLADALVMATGPYRSRGEHRCLLAEMAEPRRPLPEPDLDPAVLAALPTVPTGAGLAVPAVAIFQSVAGPEVTEPAGFDADELTRDPTAERRTRELRELVADAASTYRKEAAHAAQEKDR